MANLFTRPILEKIVWSKAGLISKRIDEIKTCVICEWNLELAYFREQKDLNFDDLAGPVKKMAIPQHGPQTELNKIIQLRTQNIKTVYTSRL